MDKAKVTTKEKEASLFAVHIRRMIGEFSQKLLEKRGIQKKIE